MVNKLYNVRISKKEQCIPLGLCCMNVQNKLGVTGPVFMETFWQFMFKHTLKDTNLSGLVAVTAKK